MDLGLTGKVAIVGGSGRGLGKACAMALAREGVKVTICSRNEQSLRQSVVQMRKNFCTEALAVVCDLTKYDDIKRLVNDIMT